MTKFEEIEMDQEPWRKADPISRQQWLALSRIVPSLLYGQLPLYPCSVSLKNDKTIDRVIIANARLTALPGGPPLLYPSTIPFSEVYAFEENADRLPPAIANQIYAYGETSMGGTTFDLLFEHQRPIQCTAGAIVDFLTLPEGYRASDAVGVTLDPPPAVTSLGSVAHYEVSLFQ